ncbi:MAG: hypothetical protein WBO44_13730 [Saprospiraceae bacterium]
MYYFVTICILVNLIPFNGQGQACVFRTPSEYVSSFIDNSANDLSSVRHKSFQIYFKDGSYVASHLESITCELGSAYNEVCKVLNIRSYQYGIYLLAVDSKDAMEELMGYKIKGGAAKGHDLVFFVCNQSIRPQFKHELFHLIAHEIWGLASHRLLDEGGATFTDNFCFYKNPMYTINAYYYKQKQLIPLQKLLDHFDEETKKNDVLTYIQSAGVFKYLYETYGEKKIKQVWNKGFEQFQAIYGFPIAQLEWEWLNLIQTIPIPVDFDINLLREGCG